MDDCKIITGDARSPDFLSWFGGQKFGVIVADPPWKYDFATGEIDTTGANLHYDTMEIEELCAIPVPQLAADDCALFLWGTWPKKEQADILYKSWGFEYVTGLPWIKTTKHGYVRFGGGYWWRGCSELIYICRKGKVSPPKKSERYAGIICPSFEHSRKPDDIHDVAEQLVNHKPYLELFARRPRKGWTVFGNNINEDVQPELIRERHFIPKLFEE